VPRFRDPEPLEARHDIAGFDCGTESLNRWLKKHAMQARGAGSARTYVVHDEAQDRIVGYHALTAASIAHERATERAAKGMPRHPIPAILLARLAVDSTVQSRGLGAWLLRDAMLRALSASDAVGIRVLLVHAIDDGAAVFYARRGFERSATDAHHHQMIVEDIRAGVDHAGS
jgi:GNAT superfamily N-acetyltransferase